MKNYVVYHLHTELSLLDSCTNYQLYIDKASELSQKAICFTEHGNIYNWIEKKMYCDSKGIKYLHGIEIYLTEKLQPKVRDNYHTILIAKNYDGVKEINTLFNLSSREDHFYFKPRISFDEFFNISDNVIKISACLASPLARILEEKEDNELEKKITPYLDKLVDTYDFLEIQPHINSLDQKKYNHFLSNISEKYNKPLIAGSDTHSLNDYKAQCRKILKKAKKIEYANEDEYDLTYKTYDEIFNMFKEQGCVFDKAEEALENTNVMADMVETFELDVSFKYPKLYENDNEKLIQLIKDKLKEKINQNKIDKNRIKEYIDRIQEELKVLKKIDMMGFILFTSEVMQYCRKNNIYFTPCRGSVGGCEVAYIVDIIDVDPIVRGTVFSRFANENRKEIGDIDVDIWKPQRAEVYNYIINRFSKEKTAYILATGTISDKGCIDEIFRAFRYSWEEKHKGDFNNPYSIQKADEVKLEYSNNPTKTREDYPDIFYFFDGLINTTISQSMHPAGIVVSPISLYDNYGTFWKEDDGEYKQILSINMEEIHEISLLKVDILGLKNVGVISETCRLANLPLPYNDNIDWDDEKVWNDMITSNIGIFQFESNFGFDSMKKFKPKSINELTLLTACIRPSGESYRDSLLNREEHKNPSKQIDELLKENHGFLCYQEDIIKFLQEVCGLSGSEADDIRRGIARKQLDRLNSALPNIIEGYCKNSDKSRDVAEEEVKEFIQIIIDASSYMFGFNHAVGYSMLGYLCAYYRYYYPLEFVCSLLNTSNSMEDTISATQLAKIKNINIHNIKFGKSKGDYMIDKDNFSIYKGIGSIKFLNNTKADELYELSKQKKYTDFIDLLNDITEKTSLDVRSIKILILLNYFSDFGENKMLTRKYTVFYELKKIKQINKNKIDDKSYMDINLLKKYSNKETDKMLKEIDIISYIKEYTQNFKNDCFELKYQLCNEKEFIGSPCYVNDELPEEWYFVSDFVTYKDKFKPYLMLYNIKNGDTVKTKITKGKMFQESPFQNNSIIFINEFRETFKKKCINNEWVFTEEKEQIINDYEVLVL